MKFTVMWTKTAERNLADIWLSAPNRGLIANAANAIDRLLQIDPEQQGESRESGRRILLASPLGVKFRVNPDDRTVRILYVWQF